MIDKVSGDAQPLNSYNVAQLQFALEDPKHPNAQALDSLAAFDVHILDHLQGDASPAVVHTPDVEQDYFTRRMSSSAASDDSSSLQSTRPEKRPGSPSLDSPLPRKTPSLGPASAWSTSNNTPSPQPNQDHHDTSRSEYSSPRVQLPSLASTFQDQHEVRRASLPTLYSESSANRLRLPHPAHRSSQSTSGLTNYQFPDAPLDDKHRPRLATDTSQLGLYPAHPQDYASSLSSSSSFSFPGQSPLSSSADYKSPSSGLTLPDDSWASAGIVRPNSTPGQGVPQPQLFGGIARISGHQHHHQQHHHRALQVPGIKSEHEWNFAPGPTDYSPMSASSSPNSALPPSATPSISVGNSPTRSPQAVTPASSLVDRPPRKRGKLPKPVTDFLKEWLHRHSDHPYPSEEEKKQLCHATGLSMSQVSNWMINARRRILAPAHRAAQGPTTTTPFNSRSGPPILDGRRASMPSDTLQLYYPLSLQNLGGADHHMSSTRQLVGMTRSMSSSHATVASLSGTAAGHHHSPYGSHSIQTSYGPSSHHPHHDRLAYGSGGTLHPHAQSSSSSASSPSSYLSVPMSAPPITNPNPFLSTAPHQQQSLYSNSTQSSGGSSSYMTSPTSHHAHHQQQQHHGGHHQQQHHSSSSREDGPSSAGGYTFPPSTTASGTDSGSPGSRSGYQTPQ